MFEISFISTFPDILNNPIEYLKGVGPQKGELLKKELGIFIFKDLLEHFPFRHIDKSKFYLVSEITAETEYIQFVGDVMAVEITGTGSGKRLIAEVKDKSGFIELIWFQGLSWIQKILKTGERYLVYGRVSFFQGRPQVVHPEIEVFNAAGTISKNPFDPIYPSTEKLKSRGLSGRQLGKLTLALLHMLRENDIPETLPLPVLKRLKLISRFDSFQQIHYPESHDQYELALKRLKFEEFFMAQMRMGILKNNRHRISKGVLFDRVGELFNSFYEKHLPFKLTVAQKRVIKEIRADTAKGRQMNRMLQGDVGSGKTIVALLCMLIAIDNGYQACIMAPTEILAKQHFTTLNELLKNLPVTVRLLTGSVKPAQRKEILQSLHDGLIHILIGTHAVIEDMVQFKNLGLAIVDEQHRFGVEQRAKLWQKAKVPPHILVMTATPIPRTLAMAAYGDLDYSVIDEIPPGRQAVTTVDRTEIHRPKVMDFLRSEIQNGRQVYIIFPLIEESSKLDYENLMKGYENVKAYFPEPKYWISMVHGRQPQKQKDINMKRFVEGDTHILVSTTVVEVGVDIPNATVMVIESAEKFGLSQLHQLRGRVGRGSDKSYCILLTGMKLGNDARERLKIITSTTDGFKIAEKDLELRGPGDIEGTRQSGILNFKLASIVQDKLLLETARTIVDEIISSDPDLVSAENLQLRRHLLSQQGKTPWSRIS